MDGIYHTLDEWRDWWKENIVPWHLDEPNVKLTNQIERLIAGRKNIKILVPLCGKTKDIVYLASLGHTVVGVECCEMAVADFFMENNIEYRKTLIDSVLKCEMYESIDSRIRIYVCDFYSFSVELEGRFDGIWDRGSLGAINTQDRRRYADLILSLMSVECRYLIATFFYDGSNFKSHPRSLSKDIICELFNRYDIMNIELLGAVHRKAPRPEMIEVGVEEVRDEVHILTFKESL